MKAEPRNKACNSGRKPTSGHTKVLHCRGYSPPTRARTEAALEEIVSQFRALLAEAVRILSELAHIARLLVDLKRKVFGKDPKEYGEKPAQFMYGARPRSSAAPSGRAKERVEDRAISASFQRTAFDLVNCPNHGSYPHCMCGVTGSLTVGSFSAEIPRYTF